MRWNRVGYALAMQKKGKLVFFSWVKLEPVRSDGGSGVQVRGEDMWRACEVHFYEVVKLISDGGIIIIAKIKQGVASWSGKEKKKK